MILTTIIIFFNLIIYIIIFDIILSWLVLFGIKIRPVFVVNIIDPMYNYVRKYIPTTIGPVDFTPIILLISIQFIQGIIFSFIK